MQDVHSVQIPTEGRSGQVEGGGDYVACEGGRGLTLINVPVFFLLFLDAYFLLAVIWQIRLGQSAGALAGPRSADRPADPSAIAAGGYHRWRQGSVRGRAAARILSAFGASVCVAPGACPPGSDHPRECYDCCVHQKRLKASVGLSPETAS